MPYLPINTKCATLGCKNKRSRFSTHCLDHGGRDEQRTYNKEERKERNALYKTAQWQAHRQLVLSRSPICAACILDGIVTPATEVDHVFPWSQIGQQAFYLNIFQSLCKPCHTYKTAQEQRGVILYYHQVQSEYTIRDYQRVVNPH
jgi:hypothetical protein